MMDENLQYNQILPMLKDGEDFWCVFKHGLIRDDESMDTLKAKIREYLDEMAEIEKESESPEEIKEAHEELSKCLREINGEKFDKPIHKKMCSTKSASACFFNAPDRMTFLAPLATGKTKPAFACKTCPI